MSLHSSIVGLCGREKLEDKLDEILDGFESWRIHGEI